MSWEEEQPRSVRTWDFSRTNLWVRNAIEPMWIVLLFSDGCAIAHAVSNYLKEKTQCRTIFSTHYHELTQEYSESQTKGVLIYHMNVLEAPSEEVGLTLRIFFEKRFENCVHILLKCVLILLGIFRWVGRYCVFVHCGFGTLFEISRLQRSQVSGSAKVNHRSWKIRSWRIRNRAEKSSTVLQNHQQPLAL